MLLHSMPLKSHLSHLRSSLHPYPRFVHLSLQPVSRKNPVFNRRTQSPSKWNPTAVCTSASPKSRAKWNDLNMQPNMSTLWTNVLCSIPIAQRQPHSTVDSSPASVNVHTNKEQHLNELLVEEEQEETQDVVMRTFLECLYGTVGYVPSMTANLRLERTVKIRRYSSTPPSNKLNL